MVDISNRCLSCKHLSSNTREVILYDATITVYEGNAPGIGVDFQKIRDKDGLCLNAKTRFYTLSRWVCSYGWTKAELNAEELALIEGIFKQYDDYDQDGMETTDDEYDFYEDDPYDD